MLEGLPGLVLCTCGLVCRAQGGAEPFTQQQQINTSKQRAEHNASGSGTGQERRAGWTKAAERGKLAPGYREMRQTKGKWFHLTYLTCLTK